MIGQFGNIILGIVSGILTVPVIALFLWVSQYCRSYPVRRFWKPFLGKKITIVVTEYKVEGEKDDIYAKTSKIATDGYLISKGNALTISNLTDFLANHIVKRAFVTVCGDKSATQSNDYLIVSGAPAINNFSQRIFSNLEDRFHIPYSISHSQQTGEISFQSKDGTKTFRPEVENGQGVDYAIVIRAQYKSFPDSYVILLVGAHMYGAQAASSAITNRAIISHLAKM